jgi:hypothetical protein
MNCTLPSAASGFFGGKAGILAPTLIDEVDVPVRQCSPYQPGKRIDKPADCVAHVEYGAD